MKMTIYWTKQHSRRAVHEFRFRRSVEKAEREKPRQARGSHDLAGIHE